MMNKITNKKKEMVGSLKITDRYDFRSICELGSLLGIVDGARIRFSGIYLSKKRGSILALYKYFIF